MTFPDVPPQMACPHCGGYVRGHQWIGKDRCSIQAVFDEPMLFGLTTDDCQGDDVHAPQRCVLRDLFKAGS
jgi:hypothetical protein